MVLPCFTLIIYPYRKKKSDLTIGSGRSPRCQPHRRSRFHRRRPERKHRRWLWWGEDRGLIAGGGPLGENGWIYLVIFQGRPSIEFWGDLIHFDLIWSFTIPYLFEDPFISISISCISTWNDYGMLYLICWYSISRYVDFPWLYDLIPYFFEDHLYLNTLYMVLLCLVKCMGCNMETMWFLHSFAMTHSSKGSVQTGHISSSKRRPFSYWCLVGNGWEWIGMGMIINS